MHLLIMHIFHDLGLGLFEAGAEPLGRSRANSVSLVVKTKLGLLVADPMPIGSFLSKVMVFWS